MRTLHMIARNDADVISTLPDYVCSLIVSFLPPREAVATSVLSWRWRYVWASSPSLDFDFPSFPIMRRRKQAFVDYVDRAISNFDGVELRKFRVSLEGYGGAEPRLDDWTKFAAARSVEDLELWLPRGRSVRLHDFIFECASITSLTLRMCKYTIDLPSPASLKQLRKLELWSISSLNGSFFRELSSNCLLLEELCIGQCRIDVLDMEAPTLKTLAIVYCHWVRPSLIRVSAPSMKSLTYGGRLADDHSFENLSPCLDEVNLDLDEPSKLNLHSQPCLSNLIGVVANATTLTLSSWCIETIYRAPDPLAWALDNVQILSLSVALREDDIQMIADLLVSCPNVEELEITIKNPHRVRRTDGAGRQRQRQEARMRRLRNVKLENVCNRKSILTLVSFLLQHAPVLEKMTLVTSMDGLDKEEFKQKVSNCSRASSSPVAIEYCTG